VLIAKFTGISRVVEGDLVYKKECPLGELTEADTLLHDDVHTTSPEMDMSCETVPEEVIQCVKVFYRQIILVPYRGLNLCISYFKGIPEP
jgi:hypothetical protein